MFSYIPMYMYVYIPMYIYCVYSYVCVFMCISTLYISSHLWGSERGGVRRADETVQAGCVRVSTGLPEE